MLYVISFVVLLLCLFIFRNRLNWFWKLYEKKSFRQLGMGAMLMLATMYMGYNQWDMPGTMKLVDMTHAQFANLIQFWIGMWFFLNSTIELD